MNVKITVTAINTKWGRCNCYDGSLHRSLNSFVGKTFKENIDLEKTTLLQIDDIVRIHFSKHCEQFIDSNWSGWEHATFTFEWSLIKGEDIE